MILIASVHTVPGDYSILISDDESEEDDCCVYDIGNITCRIISSVRVQETPTVEHVCISYLRQHEAYQEELVKPNTFAYKQKHSSVDAATISE